MKQACMRNHLIETDCFCLIIEYVAKKKSNGENIMSQIKRFACADLQSVHSNVITNGLQVRSSLTKS